MNVGLEETDDAHPAQMEYATGTIPKDCFFAQKTTYALSQGPYKGRCESEQTLALDRYDSMSVTPRCGAGPLRAASLCRWSPLLAPSLRDVSTPRSNRRRRPRN